MVVALEKQIRRRVRELKRDVVGHVRNARIAVKDRNLWGAAQEMTFAARAQDESRVLTQLLEEGSGQ